MQPRFHNKEGAANRIHREHPQAMRSQRFVPPSHTVVDARAWDHPDNRIVPLSEIEQSDRRLARNLTVICLAALALAMLDWHEAIGGFLMYLTGAL